MVSAGASSLSSRLREPEDEESVWMDVWCPSIRCTNGPLVDGPFRIFSPWRRHYCSKCGNRMKLQSANEEDNHQDQHDNEKDSDKTRRVARDNITDHPVSLLQYRSLHREPDQ